MALDQTPRATLYRMVMEDHLCPYGLKSKDLLERQGFEVDDHRLTTREETDAFKASTVSKRRPRPSSAASGSAATTPCANISDRLSRMRTRPAISP